MRRQLQHLSLSDLFSVRASIIYVSWLLLHYVLYLILPARIVQGTVINAKGDRLDYPLNGLSSMFVSMAILLFLVLIGVLPATFAYDEFLPLCSAAIIFCLAFSLYTYTVSFIAEKRHPLSPTSELSLHGQTGNLLYDFFIGRPLNPRLFNVDLKYLCELRPGLIGWMVIDLSFMAAQYKEQGEITVSIILVTLFQAVYVLDALMSEEAILTTMDITSDGFGYMLIFGDLAWVPFTYSLQARYLVDYPTHLSFPLIILIIALKCLGLYIFRSANNEKNEFRSNSDTAFVRQARYILTESGSRLLVSGWWGRSRHANYMGDILMATAWCLPCGFQHFPVTYFYVLYFSILLIHRQRRDDLKCRAKYGKEWESYCQQVPYRIFPYLY
jgi:hypothetical protein